MIPKEILKQIKYIEIKTGKLVQDVFAGEYHSIFKGRGMEFSEVRQYLPGDDIRTIDWNVTARFGFPFVKKFVEERELTVMLLVDMSGSNKFGTFEKFKSEIAAEISAVIAFSAIKNNDKVGMIMFTDEVENFILPKKGKKHILRIIREILYFKPKNKMTDINQSLKYLNDVIKRKAVVFLISDFRAEGWETLLRITNKKHDLIAISISDPKEKYFPEVGLLELEDSETGDIFLLDTNNKKVVERLSEMNIEREEKRRKFFKSSGIDFVEISTDKSYIEPIVNFFRMRARRFR